MKLAVSEQFIGNLKSRFLILDTNVFIDASKPEGRAAFADFFTRLHSGGCLVVTITAVAIEFLKGARNFTEMRQLKDYLETVCNGVLILHEERDAANQSFIEPELVLSYGERARLVSYTDYLLAKALKKYKTAALLTSNHKDFPTSVFDREEMVILHKEADVTSYGVYRFSEKKYSGRMQSLTSTRYVK